MSNNAASVVVESSGAIAVTIERPRRGTYARASSQQLNAGDITVSVTFDTALPDANYIPTMQIGNRVDNPDLAPVITAHPYSISAGGFVMRLSSSPLTNNYEAFWTIAEILNP